MRCTIRFIGCHPVSPQEERAWAEKRRGKVGTTYKTRNREKGGKRTESRTQPEKNVRTARKRQRINCNMQSWERAKPLSLFEVFPDGTGRRFGLENSGWRSPLGYYNVAKYLPSDFFIDLVLCVVGRFACQVPDLSATRMPIPERFFGRKITAGNFMSRKPEA